MIKTEYWTYQPKLFPSYVFPALLDCLKNYIDITNKRSSCWFGNAGTKIGYTKLPRYDWSDAPSIITEICKLTEQYTNEKYDYVLVHIYPDGNSSINWHNDSEAMNSSVASVNFGATRKFRLKPIGQKTGYETELKLNDGDMLLMHGPDLTSGRLSCQNVYYHTVPVEKTVKQPRINLTFRQSIL